MPSTIVHLAFAGLLASALLGAAFETRALAVVLVVVAIPDLDSFIAIFVAAEHRAILHNIWVPLLMAAVLWYDTTIRSNSTIRERYGEWAVRVGWVSIVCFVFAGLALDIVNGIMNPLWPVHDQFYHIDGKLELSDQRGIVQTFVETGNDGGGGDGGGISIPAPESVGSSEEVNVTTGVDPAPAEGDEDPERIFPLFRAGWELMLFVVGTTVTAARLRMDDPEDN
jgi:inner membrane protein